MKLNNDVKQKNFTAVNKTHKKAYKSPKLVKFTKVCSLAIAVRPPISITPE